MEVVGTVTLLPNPLVIPVGLVIGILVAAPVGPVNILCIQRAIERGFLGGVAAGLGAVLGDGLIALSAAFGVSAISGAVRDYQIAIQILGGLALALFGYKLHTARPHIAATVGQPMRKTSLSDYLWDIPQTFVLTITNPGAVLGLFAIFGGISTFVEVRTSVDALALVTATMAGSLLWWATLSHLVGHFRHRLGDIALQRINQIAALLLIGFGALLIGEAIFTTLAAAAAWAVAKA
jgi:threonine/homoserine/homoserine lactone efflux protein